MREYLVRTLSIGALVLVVCVMVPRAAEAFCGFYVSGAESELYANATVVSLMRDGNRTVMAMQNNYEGPAEDFALVIPVPEVLEEERVKTLEDEVFERLDNLTAPRLVEYWQRDPCPDWDETRGVRGRGGGGRGFGAMRQPRARSASAEGSVEIEAKFDVGEYEVVVLSSDESNALDEWLRERDYNIPDGAAEYFEPYIEQGQYFFVAKVDIEKVEYEDGRAVLSPLRFYYDSEDFKLPVRLGLINSKGEQDLFAMILARGQRYRVANHPNEVIPTNLPVDEEIEEKFGGFYESLFRRVREENPEAVVTEYAWNASSCDPCPTEPLSPSELATLGADVLPSESEEGRPARGRFRPDRGGWVVTRLHARYARDDLGEDLVFEKATPIRGGRGVPVGKEGNLPRQAAERAPRNAFQARYVIRHEWEGGVDCRHPRYAWGGPPEKARGGEQADAAGNLAFDETHEEIALVDAVEQETIPGVGRLEATDDSAFDQGDRSEEASSRSGGSDAETSSEVEPSRGGAKATDGERKSSCSGCRASPTEVPLSPLVVMTGALIGTLFATRRRQSFDNG